MLLRNIAHDGSFKDFTFVYLCICDFVIVFVIAVRQWFVGIMSFQKIYGLYGLEHHTVEINGDVTMRTDDEQTNK